MIKQTGWRVAIGGGAALAIAASLLLVERSAVADGSCGLQGCIVGIPTDRINRIAAIAGTSQEQSEWCWAASISMLFGYYGHPVSQEQIVRQAFGQLVNMPGSPALISQALNREWVDTRGKHFRSSAIYSDAAAGGGAVNNDVIANELHDNHPLIVGAVGHAMLLTAMTYQPIATPDGMLHVGRVFSAAVRDPWPYNTPRRELSASEMRPTFLAAVSIQEIAAPADDDTPGGRNLGNEVDSNASKPRLTPKESAAASCRNTCASEFSECKSDDSDTSECIDDYETTRCPDRCSSEGRDARTCAIICDRNHGTNMRIWTSICVAKHTRECSSRARDCRKACTDD
jgi:hypothetical protein